MGKSLYLTYTILGAFTVILGAFGAHGLKQHLDTYQMMIYEKAVFYQFVHLLAGLLCLTFASLFSKKGFLIPAILFLIGILLFSGSLYLLAVSKLLHIPTILIGPITPVGGIFFIIGWSSMAHNFYRTTIDYKIV
jgi:uncharacterized membrane protein YgdD (TMEM256/DUF423 family)